MAKNKYQSAVDAVEKTLLRHLEITKSIDAMYIKISKSARESVGKDFSSGLPKDLNERLKKNVQFNEQLNAVIAEQKTQMKALQDQIDKLNETKRRSNKLTVSERENKRVVTAQTKLQYRAETELLGAYSKSSAKLTLLKKRYKDLGASKLQGIKLTKEENAEYNRLSKSIPKLDKGLKQLDKSVGENFRSVGDYGRALGGLKNVVVGLIGTFGLVEGIRGAFNFTKEAIELARQAKGVEFAFERLGASGEDAFNRVKKATRGLLSDLNIKTALNEFDQFNLSVERADTLFEFLAVAASQTGKSIDELKSSLVEGLSKESKLRIDNLGISTAELNAELEKTPVFIDAVANIAERKIAKAGDILDKAGNGGEKFASSMENAKLALGQLFSGSGGGFLGAFAKQLDSIAKGLDRFKDGIQTLKKGVTSFITPIKELVSQSKFLTSVFTSAEKTGGNFLKKVIEFLVPMAGLGEKIEKAGKKLKVLGAFLSGVGAGFRATKKEVIDFVEALSKLEDIDFNLLDPIGTAKSAKTVFKGLVTQAKEGGSNVAEAYREGFANAMKPLADEASEVAKQANSKEVSDAVSNVSEALENSIAYYEQLITTLKKTRAETALTKESWDEQTEAIKDVELALSRLKSEFEGIVQTVSSLDSEGIDLSIGAEGIAEKIAVVEDVLTNLPWDEALEEANNFFQEIGSLSGTFFDRKIQQYDDDINRNELYYSRLLDNENLSNTQRNAIEAEQERKRVELEKKKREEQRKQAVVEKAFNAVSIIANTAVAVSKALAQGGFVFGVPQSAIVASLGALQLATVLAQPIPQFKDGHLSGTYEGLAMINDAPSNNYREVVERKDGRLEMFSGRNTLIDMDKGDKVHKAGTFDVNQIIGNSINMSMFEQQEKITRAQQNQLDLGQQIRDAFSGVQTPNVTAKYYGASAEDIGRATANELYKLNRAHN